MTDAKRSARTLAVPGSPVLPLEICEVHPALPAALAVPGAGGRSFAVATANGDIDLGNDFLRLRICGRRGIALEIENRLAGETSPLVFDQTGCAWTDAAGRRFSWLADADGVPGWEPALGIECGPAGALVRFSGTAAGIGLTLEYSLGPGDFWVERRLRLEFAPAAGEVELQEFYYGCCRRGGLREGCFEPRTGKFDRPRLLRTGRQGGVFSGVAWWFYSVDENGLCRNNSMRFRPAAGIFQGEPWYLGVFRREPGEPWAGWAWYKAFLQRRKDAYDRRGHWLQWNAGWGQWNIEIDRPQIRDYAGLCKQLGLDGVIFGSGCYGKKVEEYAELVAQDQTTQENLRLLNAAGIAAGVIEAGPVRDDWSLPATLEKHRAALRRLAAAPGFGSLHFDYFYVADNFTAKWQAAAYLRECRAALAYTECHLGMAEYGPQYQREVLCNHPADLEAADLSGLSIDWATFRAFRQSRAHWQQSLDWLPPECGLYYFFTHYHNCGHPRKYTDPEPMQLTNAYAAYAGALNFHDAFGYRQALAGAAVFSQYLVLGHLEKTMPAHDVAFTAAFVRWLRENHAALRPARICQEDRDTCVVSKLSGGAGLLCLLNYTLGRKQFRLDLRPAMEAGRPCRIRQVFPVAGPELVPDAGGGLQVETAGETVCILEVNRALRSLPPEDRSVLGVQVPLRPKAGGAGVWAGSFSKPAWRRPAAEPTLPRKILVIDTIQGAVDREAGLGQTKDPDLEFAGKFTELPQFYLDGLGIRDHCVDTGRVAPWAMPDRAWLLYTPARPGRPGEAGPQLRINGRELELRPRFNTLAQDPQEWDCPLYFADVTELLRGRAGRFRVEFVPAAGDTARPPLLTLRLLQAP